MISEIELELGTEAEGGITVLVDTYSGVATNCELLTLSRNTDAYEHQSRD